MQKIPY